MSESEKNCAQRTAEENMLFFLNRLAAEGDTINTAFPLTFHSLDMEKQEALFSVTVTPYSRNVYGTMHGGALATVLDVAMSLMCKAVIGEDTAPSLDMSINFLKGVPIGETLYLRASVVRAGRTIVVVQARGWTENEASPNVSSTGSFYRLP